MRVFRIKRLQYGPEGDNYTVRVGYGDAMGYFEKTEADVKETSKKPSTQNGADCVIQQQLFVDQYLANGGEYLRCEVMAADEVVLVNIFMSSDNCLSLRE